MRWANSTIWSTPSGSAGCLRKSPTIRTWPSRRARPWTRSSAGPGACSSAPKRRRRLSPKPSCSWTERWLARRQISAAGEALRQFRDLAADLRHGDDFPGLAAGDGPDRIEPLVRPALAVDQAQAGIDFEAQAVRVDACDAAIEQIAMQRVGRAVQVRQRHGAVDNPVEPLVAGFGRAARPPVDPDARGSLFGFV